MMTLGDNKLPKFPLLKEEVVTDQKGHALISLTFVENVTNLEVAEIIEHHIQTCFNFTGINKVYVIIEPNKHKILIKPYYKLNITPIKGVSCIECTLRDEHVKEWRKQVTFIGAESVVDIWNKFMATHFIICYDRDKQLLHFYMNIVMDDKQRKAYWIQNTTDGYNLEASFWRREWLKDEHKRQRLGGGKL